MYINRDKRRIRSYLFVNPMSASNLKEYINDVIIAIL